MFRKSLTDRGVQHTGQGVGSAHTRKVQSIPNGKSDRNPFAQEYGFSYKKKGPYSGKDKKMWRPWRPENDVFVVALLLILVVAILVSVFILN